jgi:tol-pal system protein YbgF
MPSYTEQTRAEVMDLAAQSKDTGARVDALEAALAAQTEMLRAIRAESSANTQLLLDRIEILEQMLGTSGDRRSRPAAQQPPSAGFEPARAETGAATSAATGSDDARARYDAAYLELLKGNYDLAIVAFRDYLDRYADADLADNAQYWIGECHFARGETPEAIDAFMAVETRWPHGDKVPGALLKIAYCHQNEGNTGGARRGFEDLISRYPNTEEARLAREKLNTLPSGG